MSYSLPRLRATARICKHVPLTWEGELTDRYSKSAKRVVSPEGRLLVWSPEKQ